jgi:membrane protein DedA with SNARE-associated domain
MVENQPTSGRPSLRWGEWHARDLFWLGLLAGFVLLGRFSPIKPVRNFWGGFGWLTEQALKITKELFESYGYLTVFLAPLLENTIFLGALIPGTLVILLAGLAAHDGLIDFWRALPLGIAGAWIGDTISYGIGRFGSKRLGPEARLVRWSERMRGPLLENSAWLVLLYHFAGYSRLIGPAASGFLRMPLRRWMLLDYLGAAVWVVAYMTGGYVLGIFSLSLDATDSNVRAFEVILFVFAVIAVIVVVSRTRAGRRRGGEGAEADDERATAARV